MSGPVKSILLASRKRRLVLGTWWTTSWLWALTFAGCGSPADECLEQHDPSSNPTVTVDQTKFGDGHSELEVEPLREVCRERGLSCADQELLGRDAAICLATAAGLEAGEAPWTAFLEFDPTFDSIVWRVCNTEAQGVGGASGRVVVIDAATGQELAWEEWLIGA